MMDKPEKKMINEFKEMGYTYYDSNDIFKQKRLFSKEVDIILRWLPAIYKQHVGTGDLLARSLISSVEPFNPASIIDLFENSNYNSTVKWTMAYVLAISKTYDISDWMMNQLLDKPSSFERGGLISGLTIKAGIKTRGEFMGVLRQLFDKYCYFEGYLKLYKKYATISDMPFLQEKLNNPNMQDYLNYVKGNDITFKENKEKDAGKRFERDIMKVIKGIRERKKECKFPSEG